MPKRQSVKRFTTEEVQGEDSFVVLSGIKLREVKAVRKLAEGDDFDQFERGLKLLADHILEWNWVDDAGNPLSLPKDDAKIIDELTNEESELLTGLLMGETKNSESAP